MKQLFPTIVLLFSFSGIFAQFNWSAELSGLNTFSSPRVSDLNLDGVGDIILGAGRQEFQACDSAVIALDGRTGALLWHVGAGDQIFGSANLKDITGDGVDEVFIGGRSAELIAINGRNGKVLWRFLETNAGSGEKGKDWFNFYNPQFIPDQNGDGVEDILVSNGGNVLVEPYDPNRPPGHLLIIDSKTGLLLAKASTPDGKETYMSVSLTKKMRAGMEDYAVAFGTGGETIGGNFFVTFLSDIKKGDISDAIHLDASPNKGYIGPPAWVDINGDGEPDLVCNGVEGRLTAFDGKDFRPLWKTQLPGTEGYTSVAVGRFTPDRNLDLFVSNARGVWPDLEWCVQFMVNGRSGEIEFVDSLGYYQTSTPVTADVNNDGRDEAICMVNFQEVDSLHRKFFYNTLMVVDFEEKRAVDLGLHQAGHTLSTTPWIGDMDNDQMLDIVYVHGTNLRHNYIFDGMKVHRISTTIPIKDPVRWGAYMGSDYDGVFKE